jgi:phosphoglycolate phosphatase
VIPTARDALRSLLADTDALLLDFDGPVCSVFAGLPASVVVDQLCVVLADGGYGDPPPDIEKSSDPFDVLKYAATLGHEEGRFVNAALTAHEVEAVAIAEPTPGAHDFIRAWSATGRPLAIVSNNSTLAVEAYLSLNGLKQCIKYVSGRTGSDTTLLKPHPYLIRTALASLQAPADMCTLVGDSVTDIEAAHAAGTRSVGYANKQVKISKFASSRADFYNHQN